MVFSVFKSLLWGLLTVICLILCFTSAIAVETRAAVSPAYGCVLHNDTYICSGSQYRLHCNTRKHHFYYQRSQDQHQYQCMSNDCVCVGNTDTCACYSNTTSCFCETFSVGITVRPVYECVLYNKTYICTGAQYHMYCNTSVHSFHYYRHHHHCLDNNCNCIGDGDTCTCYNNMLSSCFCTNYSSSILIPAAVSPVYNCGLYNGTYICSGAQYRMYCNTRMHNFYYWRYRNQNQYQYECWGNNCNCFGDKDTCTCYSSTSSTCFCETYSNSTGLTTAVSPVTDPDCVLHNQMYICTGAQYRMYCNTQMHDFSYQRYQYQYQFQCVSNDCDCFGDKDTCTCSSSTLSSCFCMTYGNITALTAAVSPVNDCVLYNDTYICTGAQYRMYCNTRMHDFSYSRYRNQNQYQSHCSSNNCYCTGNEDTCTCYSSILSSCFCEPYGNIIALTTAVSPVNDCVLYNDMYICSGAQYHMYCNTSIHYFHYRRDHYHCLDNNCDCIGDGDTCTCYSNTSSSCFCTSYNSSITIPAAVSPVYDCGLYNDTHVCTGAQYRMYCNRTMHGFYYQIYRNQTLYGCWGNNCFCFGDNDTCTCYGSTLSSCFCETNIFTPTTAGANIVLPDQHMMNLVILVCVIVGLVLFSLALLTFALYKWSPLRDWIHGSIVLGPKGYSREELRSSTRSASDVFVVYSNRTTSEVSQNTQKTTKTC